MPKEVTSFRIDFEGIAWMDTATTIPETFNPDEFTPVELDDIPTKFNLQSAGNVATSDLYKQVSLSAIEMHENSMEGTLFNYGIQEVTIPQLLVSYYDKDKKLIWVASQFMREGVRIQRKQYFAYEWENLIDVEVLNSSLENCYVNGLPNESIAKKVIPNRKESHHQENLQAVKAKDFSYIKVELNSYIGNPH
tara:strand:- start:135 stop:713 length:579 start_codon:yes stop_codon:yes gene_type:complete